MSSSRFLDRQREAKSQKLSQLVTHVLGYPVGDNNHNVALDWCEENLDERHIQFQTTSKHDVQRAISDLADKMKITNSIDKAVKLRESFATFEEKCVPETMDADTSYSIIRLLVLLSSTRSQKQVRPYTQLLPQSSKKAEARTKLLRERELAGTRSEVEAVGRELQAEWESEWVRSVLADPDERNWLEEQEEDLELDSADDTQDLSAAAPKLGGAHTQTVVGEEDGDTISSGGSKIIRAVDLAIYNEEDDTSETSNEKVSLDQMLERYGMHEGAEQGQVPRSWNSLGDQMHQHLKEGAGDWLAEPLPRVTERSIVFHVLELLRGHPGPLFCVDSGTISSSPFKTGQALADVVRLKHPSVAVTHLSEAALANCLHAFTRAASHRAHITHFINRHSHAAAAGRTHQALASALGVWLNLVDYDIFKFEINTKNTSATPTTLLSLQHQMAPNFQRLKFMFSILQKCHQVDISPQTHTVLTILYESFLAQSLAADREGTRISFHLLMCTLEPYLQLMDRWTREGEIMIADPFEEFMIKQSAFADPTSADYWNNAFLLRPRESGAQDAAEVNDFEQEGEEVALENTEDADRAFAVGDLYQIPSFLAADARSILLTGKVNHLLKTYSNTRGDICESREWIKAGESSKSLSIQMWDALTQLQAVSSSFSSPLTPTLPHVTPHSYSSASASPLNSFWRGSSIFSFPKSAPRTVTDMLSPRESHPISSWMFSNPQDSEEQESELSGLLSSISTLVSPSVHDGENDQDSDDLRMSSRLFIDSKFDLFSPEKSDNGSFTNPGSALLPALLQPLRERYSAACRSLHDLMVTKCFLIEHLAALRHFFFMQRGETAVELTSALFARLEEWDESTTNLNQTLQDWLASSPATEQFLCDRLFVSVDQTLLSTGEHTTISTLECLHFFYNVPWPLNQVIKEDSIQQYSSVFILLLQIVRAKQALESMTSSASKGRTQTARSKLAHSFYMLKSEVYHFINHIHQHISMKANDGCWKDLCSRLTGADTADLDSLRRAHEAYLNAILKHTLLFNAAASVVAAIRKNLTLCMDLNRLHASQLFDFIEQSAENVTLTLESVAVQRLESIRTDFHHNLRTVLIVLSKGIEEGDYPDYEQLLARLNFNDFYTKPAPTSAPPPSSLSSTAIS